MALNNSNTTTRDVATYIGSSSTSNIKLRDIWSQANNPWSKRKPMALKVPNLSDDILKANNYGIKLLSANSPLDLYNKLILQTGGSNVRLGYELAYPATPTSTNVRLGDFRSFDKDAVVPIANKFSESEIINLADLPSSADKSYQTSVESMDITGVPATNINRNDIFNGKTFDNVEYKDYSGLTRGVLFYKSATEYCWSTSSIPKAYGTYTVDGTVVDVSPWRLCDIGVPSYDWWVMEFVTNVPANTFSNNYTIKSTDIFYAVPYAAHKVIVTAEGDIGEPDLVLVMNSASGINGKSATYSFSITYNGPSNIYSYSGSNLTVNLCNSSNLVIDTKVHGSFTVSNATADPIFTGIFNNNEVDDGSYIVVSWEANGFNYEETVELEVFTQVDPNVPNCVLQGGLYTIDTSVSPRTANYSFGIFLQDKEGVESPDRIYTLTNLKVSVMNTSSTITPTDLVTEYGNVDIMKTAPIFKQGTFTSDNLLNNSFIRVTWMFEGQLYEVDIQRTDV